MKTMTSRRTFARRLAAACLLTALVVCSVGSQNADAQLTGLWEFNNAANIGQATIGNDLIFEGDAPTHSVSLADDNAVSLSGVITTAAAVSTNRIRADHGIAPNGGGAFVNQYTIVADIFSPVDSRNSWRTLYQTNTGNSNDGEYFIRNDNDNVGVGDLGYSTSPIDETAWTRLAVTVDLTQAGGDFITYLNGAQHFVHPGNPGVDGRFSLDPFLFFFTDNDGDNAPLNVGALAIFDRPLSPFQVAALGVAGDPITFAPNPVLELQIDRDTGTMAIRNENLGAAQAIKGYSVLSPAGALIEENYTPLADGDSNWIQFTAAGATGDLSEGHLTTGSIPNGATIMLDNGIDGAWLKYFDENEISFEYLDGDSNLIQGDVVFTGTTQTVPFPQGDLNFDGAVDGLDWNVYVADLGSTFPGLSPAQSYRLGDLDGNGINNHADFIAFKNLFDAANGAGAFNAMLAGNPVPEPASWLLVTTAALVISLRRRCASMAAMLLTGVFAISGAAQAQLVSLWEFENPANLNQATLGSNLVPTGSITAVAGSGGADTGAALVDPSQFFTATNPIGVNGGGATKTNQYTIVMDINTTSTGFNALLDMDLGGDGDFFIRGDGGIGISGDYAGNVNDGQWHRLVMAYDLGSSAPLTRYIDGVSFGVVNVNDPTADGRFGLQSTFTAFSDNGGGEEFPTAVSNMALFSTTLNELQVSLLGNAGDPIEFFDPKLTINVNKTTGNITIANESGVDLPQGVNFYEIVSGDGVGGDGLLTTTGWNSLSNQSGITAGIDPVDAPGSPTPGPGNDPGETWDEGGGSGADRLTEAFLLGSTAFDDDFSVSLGNVYTGGPAGAEDLVFRFGLTGGGLIDGIVNYFTPASVLGDYNGNGIVDAADYTLWRDNLGASDESAFAPGTGNGGGIDSTDYDFWKNRFGTTSGAGALNAAAVPEPAAGLLAAFAALLLLAARGRGLHNFAWQLAPVMFALALLLATSTNAAVQIERNYLFGDDPEENASAGITVGSGANNVAPGFTLDSGVPGDPSGSFIDIEAFGLPTYVDVSSRPGVTGANPLGISFGGNGDYLSTGFYMNRPSDFWNDINLFPAQDYPFNYDTILSHGIQLWAKPDPAGLGQMNRQQLILDTTDGGGVYISADGNWGLSFDDDVNDEFVSNVPVDTSGDGWTHLMQLGGVADLVTGKSAAIGVLLVNGVAVVATPDVYDTQIGEPLVIGANLAGSGEFYNGVIDDVRIFLWGDNSNVPAGPVGQQGRNYGALNLGEDNDWIRLQLESLGVTDLADVNLDGVVSGDGTGSADVDDVTAFIENWMSERTVDGIRVGDWISRQNGDLNYDGIVDLKDWAIVNAANPSMGAAIASALRNAQVPEPGSLLLVSIGCLALVALVRRR